MNIYIACPLPLMNIYIAIPKEKRIIVLSLDSACLLHNDCAVPRRELVTVLSLGSACLHDI